MPLSSSTGPASEILEACGLGEGGDAKGNCGVSEAGIALFGKAIVGSTGHEHPRVIVLSYFRGVWNVDWSQCKLFSKDSLLSLTSLKLGN